MPRQYLRFALIPGHKKLKSALRGLEPAAGVDAGANDKSNMVGAYILSRKAKLIYKDL